MLQGNYTRRGAAQGAATAADRHRRVLRLPRRAVARDRGARPRPSDNAGGDGGGRRHRRRRPAPAAAPAATAGRDTGGGADAGTRRRPPDPAIAAAPADTPQDWAALGEAPRARRRAGRRSTAGRSRPASRGSPPRSAATACPGTLIVVLALLAAPRWSRVAAALHPTPCPRSPADVGLRRAAARAARLGARRPRVPRSPAPGRSLTAASRSRSSLTRVRRARRLAARAHDVDRGRADARRRRRCARAALVLPRAGAHAGAAARHLGARRASRCSRSSPRSRSPGR